jgi:hypothetical protein
MCWSLQVFPCTSEVEPDIRPPSPPPIYDRSMADLVLFVLQFLTLTVHFGLLFYTWKMLGPKEW